MATGTAESEVPDTRVSAESGFKATTPSVFALGLVVVVLSLLSGLATYLILTGLTPIVPTHTVVVTVLMINGVLAVAMIALIAWQVTSLWIARRRQAAGARLHVRIVSLFSIIAVMPAIFLAIFASVSLDRGLDHWFSVRTKSILQNSISVAKAYLQEHGQVIRSDAVAMAAAIDEAAALVQTPVASFSKFLSAQATIRSLPLAYLVDKKGEVLASGANANAVDYPKPLSRALELAKDGRAIVIGPGETNRVSAIKRLNHFDDAYLYIIRTVNPRVLQHLRATEGRVSEYKQLEQRRAGVQVAFASMYVAIALTLLLAAIWLGFWFANRLVAPVRQLITAAGEVSSGNLDIQVKMSEKEGDLSELGATFNTMTSELQSQRNDLVDANTMLVERRRFIEAVLSGVTAGVIGVDHDGLITLANPSSESLLNLPADKLVGEPLEDVVPEFGALFQKARVRDRKEVHEQVNLFRDTSERNFAVRVTSERADDSNKGYVVTFDDVTELVSAQRTSAWADVAQRIAHEIKNPLTPIQLSAERIRRKYGASIEKDKEVFEQCTETIIRQVGDIGRMVDEFSSFARMPAPQMEENDIRDLVREAVFMFQVSHPEIEFDVKLPDSPVQTSCDRRLISQAVTNLVKNAAEAIETRKEGGVDEDFRGAIKARVETTDGRYAVEVMDNGCGLPKENRNRLVEPYMTTRTKGTGLGLAIVQKITEQHGGTLQLRDAPETEEKHRGAMIRLDLPVMKPAAKTDEADGGRGPEQRDDLSQEHGANHGV